MPSQGIRLKLIIWYLVIFDTGRCHPFCRTATLVSWCLVFLTPGSAIQVIEAARGAQGGTRGRRGGQRPRRAKEESRRGGGERGGERGGWRGRSVAGSTVGERGRRAAGERGGRAAGERGGERSSSASRSPVPC